MNLDVGGGHQPRKVDTSSIIFGLDVELFENAVEEPLLQRRRRGVLLGEEGLFRVVVRQTPTSEDDQEVASKTTPFAARQRWPSL